MGLNKEQREVAETLYRQWADQKQVNCHSRQLSRIASDLEALSKAIRSELEGRNDRAIVRRVKDQSFSVDPANRVAGRNVTHDLPTADELAAITNGYRLACQNLEDSDSAVAGL